MSDYIDLFGAEHDLAAPTTRSFTYKIATTPRSGSTLFCLDLWKMGCAGRPWEYFNPGIIAPFAARLGATDFHDYLAKLTRSRSTGNGVFGYKIFVDQLMYFRNRYGDAILEFAEVPTIFLSRRDKLAQAISFVRAMDERVWSRSTDAAQQISRTPSEADLEKVRKYMAYLIGQEKNWEYHFERSSIDPLRIVYEDYVENQTAHAATLLDWLPAFARDQAEPATTSERLMRQRDATSEVWYAAYRNRHG